MEALPKIKGNTIEVADVLLCVGVVLGPCTSGCIITPVCHLGASNHCLRDPRLAPAKDVFLRAGRWNILSQEKASWL